MDDSRVDLPESEESEPSDSQQLKHRNCKTDPSQESHPVGGLSPEFGLRAGMCLTGGGGPPILTRVRFVLRLEILMGGAWGI